MLVHAHAGKIEFDRKKDGWCADMDHILGR